MNEMTNSEIKKEFYKRFVHSTPPNSGVGGCDPFEGDEDFTVYPSEVWKWFESILTRTPEPTKAENGLVREGISPFPWRFAPNDRDWNSFVNACNELSTDINKYQSFSIQADNGDIVCLFGPGPKAEQNGKVIMDAITSSTPSIAKEQLLAILPNKRNDKVQFIHEDSIEDTDIVIQSEKSYNDAIDQMKQRIEKMFK